MKYFGGYVMVPVRSRIKILAAIAFAVLFIAVPANATTEMMVLLDASSSLASPGSPGTSHSKYEEVTLAVNQFLTGLAPDIWVGLRIMGGSPTSDCYTTYLYFIPNAGMRSQFQDYMVATRPAGTRALLQGIEDCIGDMGAAEYGTDKVILVITDGGDDCGREFTTLVNTLAWTSSVPRIVIIGLDLSMDVRETLGEVAAASGGRLADVESISDLEPALVNFAEEFNSNLRIHLIDSTGLAIEGDIIVRNLDTDVIVAEHLDLSDHAMTLAPGRYEVTGRYLGIEMTSGSFTIDSTSSENVNLEFDVHRNYFTLQLRDLAGEPLRARVTFLNSAMEPVLTTEVGAYHTVQLPSGTYSVEIRVGDYTNQYGGIMIGPAYEEFYELEIPVELAILEVEVTNIYGFPLNAEIKIFDMDGTIMDEAPYSSYLYSRLPPGTYRVQTNFESHIAEETITLFSGEQAQLGIDLDVAIGDLYILLRTESGSDAWGWVRVYNSDGHVLERFDRERIESPDWYVTDIPAGFYRVEAEVDNIIRVMTNVEIRENEETEITITFPDRVY